LSGTHKAKEEKDIARKNASYRKKQDEKKQEMKSKEEAEF